MASIVPWLSDRLLGREAFRQFVKFSLVGTLNTGVDFGVYLALTRGLDFWSRHLVSASVISFGVAAVSSFLLNNFWTFRRDAAGWSARLPKFLLVASGGAGLNALTLGLLVGLGVWDILAKAVATVLVLIWNFTLQKKWTFRA